MKIRELIECEVTFEENVEPEDIPIEGNYIVTEDAEEDREAENELIERLGRGDELAWCCLVVKARWKGHEGRASLGGYSFGEGDTEKDAAEEFADLRAEALADLNQKVKEAAGSLSELILVD